MKSRLRLALTVSPLFADEPAFQAMRKLFSANFGGTDEGVATWRGVDERVVREVHSRLRAAAKASGGKRLARTILLLQQERGGLVLVPENAMHFVVVVGGPCLKVAVDYDKGDIRSWMAVLHGLQRASFLFGKKSAEDSVGIVGKVVAATKRLGGLKVSDPVFKTECRPGALDNVRVMQDPKEEYPGFNDEYEARSASDRAAIAMLEGLDELLTVPLVEDIDLLLRPAASGGEFRSML